MSELVLPECKSESEKKLYWNNTKTKFDYWAKGDSEDYSARSMLNHLAMHLENDFKMSKEDAIDHLKKIYPALYEYLEKGAKKDRVVEE